MVWYSPRGGSQVAGLGFGLGLGFGRCSILFAGRFRVRAADSPVSAAAVRVFVRSLAGNIGEVSGDGARLRYHELCRYNVR